MNHDLKTWPVFFRAILEGRKNFEIRKRDRNFSVGDHVTLREYIPHANRYTDRTITVRITYMMGEDSTVPGILPGFCVFGFERIETQTRATPPVPAANTHTPQGTTLRATIVEHTPVMIVVEDERGERHSLQGPGWRPDVREGQEGAITMRDDGHWEFQDLGGTASAAPVLPSGPDRAGAERITGGEIS